MKAPLIAAVVIAFVLFSGISFGQVGINSGGTGGGLGGTGGQVGVIDLSVSSVDVAKISDDGTVEITASITELLPNGGNYNVPAYTVIFSYAPKTTITTINPIKPTQTINFPLLGTLMRAIMPTAYQVVGPVGSSGSGTTSIYSIIGTQTIAAHTITDKNSVVVTQTWMPSPNTDYTFKISIDSGKTIGESNENNNDFTRDATSKDLLAVKTEPAQGNAPIKQKENAVCSSDSCAGCSDKANCEASSCVWNDNTKTCSASLCTSVHCSCANQKSCEATIGCMWDTNMVTCYKKPNDLNPVATTGLKGGGGAGIEGLSVTGIKSASINGKYQVSYSVKNTGTSDINVPASSIKNYIPWLCWQIQSTCVVSQDYPNGCASLGGTCVGSQQITGNKMACTCTILNGDFTLKPGESKDFTYAVDAPNSAQTFSVDASGIQSSIMMLPITAAKSTPAGAPNSAAGGFNFFNWINSIFGTR